MASAPLPSVTLHRLRPMHSLRHLCGHRRLPLLLVVLGIVRAIILLLAYPPAHTVDSALFYMYAERLNGYYLPLLDHMTYPFYPFLILVTYKWLGSAFILIGLQVVMGILIAPLYYYALKPYSAVLAALTAALLL